MNVSVEDIHWIEKVETDALGEVYCAETRVGQVEKVVLVRLFHRHDMDAEYFLESIAERQALVGRQISDQLLTSLRLGVVEGRAFDLFPYLSGSSLALLIQRAKQHREIFPLDVALFVAAKVANGLRVAFEAGLDGNHLVHGFMTPHLIRVSEEGAVAIGGLEIAPALHTLRSTATTFAQFFPYLAPEVRAGEAPHSSDDVYSLGAILFELLTLKPLASPADLRIDHSIPDELRYLLNRSVAPRFQRIQSVGEWLRELKALVIAEGWGASSPELSTFVAEIDDRVHPTNPDTSEFTAIDRKIFAQTLKQHQVDKDPSPELPTTDRDDLDRATDYQTAAVARDLLH